MDLMRKNGDWDENDEAYGQEGPEEPEGEDDQDRQQQYQQKSGQKYGENEGVQNPEDEEDDLKP